MSSEQQAGLKGIEDLPVVQNDLLGKAHVEYSLAWQKVIGPRQKVIYNDMGGDAATVLLFSNASEIISTNGNPFNQYSKEYLTKYWDFIDKKPIPRAGAFGYYWRDFTAESFEPDESTWEDFRKDMADRKRRGYWNRNRTSNYLGQDRVLLIDLKKLGVEKDSIEIKLHKNFSAELSFDWAFPGENLKRRKIIYLPEHIENLLSDGKVLDNADCYYQKGSTPDKVYPLLSRMVHHLRYDTTAIVAVGYQFKINSGNLTPEAYSEGIRGALAGQFKPIQLDQYFDNIIDQLPEEDPDYEDNKYGMKMHVFKRERMPIRKYKTMSR